MKVNNQLAKLSLPDLAQRYNQTFIWYNDAAYFCLGFDGSDKSPIIILRGIDDQEKSIPFKYQHLDTTRIPSQWYAVGKNAIHLNYSTVKQYHRGYSGDNCHLINHGLKPWSLSPHDLTQMYNQPLKGALVSTKEIQNSIEKVNYKLLNSTLLIANTNVYFRRTLLGDFKNGVFKLFRPEFTHEIQEAVLSPNIMNVEATYQESNPNNKAVFTAPAADRFQIRNRPLQINPPQFPVVDMVYGGGELAAEIPRRRMLTPELMEYFNFHDYPSEREAARVAQEYMGCYVATQLSRHHVPIYKVKWG